VKSAISVSSSEFRVSSRATARGFTIIEIALCLAIIGFALVAIIAVLPRGLNVQKKNRQETIIGQDAESWMNMLGNGALSSDDLTNYVLNITNQWTIYQNGVTNSSGSDWYTQTGSSVSPAMALTNGSRILGLLGMPKRISPPFGRTGDYQSNYVIAYVRAFSGPEVDKAPQTNTTILGDAFIYRMIVENYSYVPWDTNLLCMDCYATNGLTPAQMVDRTNMLRAVGMLQTNMHDFRLRFRFPVLPSGEIPSDGLMTFRSMVGGTLLQTNDRDYNNQPLYFVRSSIYTTNMP
jgi:type II secretory pathway pseudopilin PulG